MAAHLYVHSQTLIAVRGRRRRGSEAGREVEGGMGVIEGTETGEGGRQHVARLDVDGPAQKQAPGEREDTAGKKGEGVEIERARGWLESAALVGKGRQRTDRVTGRRATQMERRTGRRAAASSSAVSVAVFVRVVVVPVSATVETS